MDSSHDLCFEEYLKCQGFPHSTQSDGLCRSPLSEVDPELLPAQLASPLTLPGAEALTSLHRPLPAEARGQGVRARSAPSKLALGTDAGAAHNQEDPGCTGQGQQQDVLKLAEAVDPQPPQSTQSAGKSGKPAVKPGKPLKAQATKRKAPSSRASKPKPAEPPGPAATCGKRQRRKAGQLPVIQEGVERLSPATASPVSPVQQIQSPHGLPHRLPPDMAGTTIPGPLAQDSSMPGITTSHPCNVSLRRLDATCMIGPGSCSGQDGPAPSQLGTAAANYQSPLPMGPGRPSLPHAAQTQAGARIIYNGNQCFERTMSIPNGAFPQVHEQQPPLSSNDRICPPISPPQLAETRSQHMNDSAGVALHARISSMLGPADGVQQINFAPVQGIHPTTSHEQQPHNGSYLQLLHSPTAARSTSVMAPAHMHHAQSPVVAAAAVCPDGQTDIGAGNSVDHLAVPNRNELGADLAHMDIAVGAVNLGLGSEQVQGLSCARMPYSPAAALAIQPGGMSRPESAFLQKPTQEHTSSTFDMAKFTSIQQGPNGGSNLPPTMIPAAARDMEGIISAACCITQPPVFASSSFDQGIEISVQMPGEQMLPGRHEHSVGCFSQRQGPSLALQPSFWSPVEMQAHTPKRPNLGRLQGLQQLPEAVAMPRHLIQLASPRQLRQPSHDKSMMYHQPHTPNTCPSQPASVFPRLYAPKHDSVDHPHGSPSPDIRSRELIQLEYDKLSSQHELAQNTAAAAATEAIGQAAQLGQGMLDAKEALAAGPDRHHQPQPGRIKLEGSMAQSRRAFLKGLKPLPMWDEFVPVPILRLKKALLEGQLTLDIPLRQLNLTVPLHALIHDQLPRLIQQLLTQLQELAPRCRDISLESSATRELLSIMGDAMCLLIVLGDTHTEAVIRAQGFHVRDAGRPAPPDLIQHAVAVSRLTPVQAAHTRLLHYKHTRQAEEVTQSLETLSSSLATAYSQERVASKRAGLASRSASIVQSILDCVSLESEHYMQLQQAFCLQVLTPFQAAKMFAAAGPYNLDIGQMVDQIHESHAGPLA